MRSALGSTVLLLAALTCGVLLTGCQSPQPDPAASPSARKPDPAPAAKATPDADRRRSLRAQRAAVRRQRAQAQTGAAGQTGGAAPTAHPNDGAAGRGTATPGQPGTGQTDGTRTGDGRDSGSASSATTAATDAASPDASRETAVMQPGQSPTDPAPGPPAADASPPPADASDTDAVAAGPTEEGVAGTPRRPTPIIPAEVEESSDRPQIAYPQAPEPVAVSREQIDALSLPSTDPKRAVVGVWQQVAGQPTADFAEGGYGATVLVFRTNGVLEVVRWWGRDGEIRTDSQYAYTVGSDNTLTISADDAEEPAVGGRVLRVPLADGGEARIEPPSLQLPARLSYRRAKDRLRIGGKTYVAVGKPQNTPE